MNAWDCFLLIATEPKSYIWVGFIAVGLLLGCPQPKWFAALFLGREKRGAK